MESQRRSPQIAVRPSLVLGTGERGEWDYFLNVRALFRLADGRIVASAPASDGLTFFSEDGRRLATVGRHGEGPGEFASVAWAHPLAGDTVLVWDAGLRRVTLIGPDGATGETVSVAPTIPSEWLVTGRDLGAVTRVLGATATRRLIAYPVFRSAFRTRGRPTVRQDTVPLAILAITGEPVARIGPIPGSEYFGGDGNSMLLPFGARLLHAVGTDRIAVTDGLSCEIEIYSDMGARLSGISHDGERAVVSDDDIAAFSDWYVRRFTELSRPSVRTELARVPFRTRAPCYSALLFDRLGSIWAQRYHQPQYLTGRERRLWDVFGADGQFHGVVESPPGLTLWDIGSDYVLGVRQDTMGVEYVQLHALSRGPS